MSDIPRIIITPGEPAGIGPDITIRILQQAWPAELIIACDPILLLERAKQLALPLSIQEFNPQHPLQMHQPGTAKVIPIPLQTPCQAGQLNKHNAHYVLETLKQATDCCLKQQAHALVTGPVHKGIMNEAHIPFTGHTEFLAQHCHVSHPIMLFATPQTNVALITTHLPLAKVPQAITTDKIVSIARILHLELKKRFAIKHPHILVCGLNPHAGEGGHLGREEIDIIEPALALLRKEKIHLTGPLPADTIFTEKYLNTSDAVLAMYHDQALPVVKYMSFGHAVNVTLGLPIIRTSVDHGTALDIAGTHHADPGSMAAALQLAIKLSLTVSH